MSSRLPAARDMIAELIGTPSVSCAHADLDMSNRGVIDRVAEWSGSLGFEIEIQPVNNDKYNLIARAGSGSDGLQFMQKQERFLHLLQEKRHGNM